MTALKFENVRVLRQGKLIETSFWIEQGKIIDPKKRFWASSSDQTFQPDEIIDGKNCIVAPGFIDVQLNGAFGIDFSDPNITPDQIHYVSKHLTQYGMAATVCIIAVRRHQHMCRRDVVLSNAHFIKPTRIYPSDD